MYIDLEDYEIDKVLYNTDIGFVKFNKYEGTNPDHPGFKVCMVKCFKWREYEMEKALRKLDWVLNIKCGKKYTDFRDDLFNKLKELSE